MTKQTAIEWLVKEVNSDCLNSSFIRPELIEKAKEMEREQNLAFFVAGIKSMDDKNIANDN